MAPMFFCSLTSLIRSSGPAPIESQSVSAAETCRPTAYCFRSTRWERKRPLNVSGFSHAVERPFGNQVPNATLTFLAIGIATKKLGGKKTWCFWLAS